MLTHMNEQAIISAAMRAGHAVLADRVFSSMLGAYSFIQALGDRKAQVIRWGTSAFLVVS